MPRNHRDGTDGFYADLATFTEVALRHGLACAVTHGVGISPVSTNLPESVKSPADALAFIAVKKGIDAQKSQAASLIALLDVNLGTRLNASA